MCQMRTRITTLNRESENAASKIRISSKNRTSLNGESEQRVHCYGRRRNEQRREGLERERRECGKFWLFKLKSWSPSKVVQPPFSLLWCIPSVEAPKVWAVQIFYSLGNPTYVAPFDYSLWMYVGPPPCGLLFLSCDLDFNAIFLCSFDVFTRQFVVIWFNHFFLWMLDWSKTAIPFGFLHLRAFQSGLCLCLTDIHCTFLVRIVPLCSTKSWWVKAPCSMYVTVSKLLCGWSKNQQVVRLRTYPTWEKDPGFFNSLFPMLLLTTNTLTLTLRLGQDLLDHQP